MFRGRLFPIRCWRWVRLALVLAAFSFGARAQERHVPVVLISIDGLKPEYVVQADAHHLRIPNLRRFLQEGSFAEGVRGVVPTVTYPSHTTLITGTSPARHGIYANTTFDPKGKNRGGWYWYAEDIRVPTLWDLAAEAHLTTANVHWPVSVAERHITWNLPQYWRAGTPDDRKLLRVLAQNFERTQLLLRRERAQFAFQFLPQLAMKFRRHAIRAVSVQEYRASVHPRRDRDSEW